MFDSELSGRGLRPACVAIVSMLLGVKASAATITYDFTR